MEKAYQKNESMVLPIAYTVDLTNVEILRENGEYKVCISLPCKGCQACVCKCFSSKKNEGLGKLSDSEVVRLFIDSLN